MSSLTTSSPVFTPALFTSSTNHHLLSSILSTGPHHLKHAFLTNVSTNVLLTFATTHFLSTLQFFFYFITPQLLPIYQAHHLRFRTIYPLNIVSLPYTNTLHAHTLSTTRFDFLDFSSEN